MYFYFYDNSLQNSKNQKKIETIEAITTKLRISGKFIGFSPEINRANQLILAPIVSENIPKTINVIGNDTTFISFINLLASLNSLKKNHALCFIPLDDRCDLAKKLGLWPLETACEFSAKRMLVKIDLGLVDDQYYFFDQANLKGENEIFCLGSDYQVQINSEYELNIFNLPLNREHGQSLNISPQDRKLNLEIYPFKKTLFFRSKKLTENSSSFQFKELRIQNSLHRLILDNSLSIDRPQKISLSSFQITLIAGRNRIF